MPTRLKTCWTLPGCSSKSEHSPSIGLALDEVVSTIWREWQAQDSAQRQGRCHLDCPGSVAFDSEHLRRIIVNLLDNAQRYAQPDASGHKQLWLGTGRQRNGRAWVQVWSSGPEIEASMQNHLFEPFFSSHSRSSGLGLFICRELCQRHGASLRYHRQACPGQPERPGRQCLYPALCPQQPRRSGGRLALCLLLRIDLCPLPLPAFWSWTMSPICAPCTN